MKNLTLLILIFVVLMHSQCGALPQSFGATSSESSITTCASNDAVCFMNNFVIYDVSDDDILGDNVTSELVTISASLPAADTSSAAPSITGFSNSNGSAVTTLTFSDPISLLVSLVIDWQDPQGNTPGFCFRIRCANDTCTESSLRCRAGSYDNLISGTWRTSLGFDAVPAGTAGSASQSLLLDIIPIAVTNPGNGTTPANGGDPIGIISGTADANIGSIPTSILKVGQTSQIPTTIESPADDDADSTTDQTSTGGTSSSANSCSSHAQCNNGTCITGTARCSGGSCYCCDGVFGNSCVDTCTSDSGCSTSSGAFCATELGLCLNGLSFNP